MEQCHNVKETTLSKSILCLFFTVCNRYSGACSQIFMKTKTKKQKTKSDIMTASKMGISPFTKKNKKKV